MNNEIRFSQSNNSSIGVSNKKETPDDHTKRQIEASSPKRKNIFFILLLLIIIAGGAFYFFNYRQEANNFSEKQKDVYYAFFLTNGQVYFGRVLEEDKKEIIVQDVHYLTSSNSGQFNTEASAPGSNGLELVKMGNEIHGPENIIYINKDHLVLYEKLREDSGVVVSIKNSSQN